MIPSDQPARQPTGSTTPTASYRAITIETAPDTDNSGDRSPVAIHYGFHTTPFGTALIALTSGKICHLDFCDDDGTTQLADLHRRWPEATLVESPHQTATSAQQIFYPEEHRPLQMTLMLKGSKFQLVVWQALLQIAPGTTTTYKHLAQTIGQPQGARAVGRAIGSNPICYLLPCHRVVRADGGLGGYRSGTARKKMLLQAEQSPLDH